jgi:hypothetical protein
LERRQTLVVSLDETVFNFVTTHTQLRGSGISAGSLLDSLVESLSTIVLTALDALRSGDPEDAATLEAMTADRGPMMERMRRGVVGGPAAIDHQQKAHLFYLTALFERAVWLMRQLAQMLRPAAAT